MKNNQTQTHDVLYQLPDFLLLADASETSPDNSLILLSKASASSEALTSIR